MTALDAWRATAASRPGYATYPDTRITPAPAVVDQQPATAHHNNDQALPHVTRWRWWHRWTRNDQKGRPS